MKKIFWINSFATTLIFLVIITNCTKDKTSTVPVLSSTEPSNITDTTAISGGNITSDGSSPITARGVCWDTITNPTIAGSKTVDSIGIGIYTSKITGLKAGVTYHLRAYASNSIGTAYGEDISFTSMVVIPKLTTTAVSAITTTTAVCGGKITSNGGAAITSRGICWNTSLNPTIANSKTTDGTGIGSFVSNITGLQAVTTYHIRAYATNSAGTAYGADILFTTNANKPTITTAAVSAVTATTAASGGNITNNGGAPIIARGVCWSKNQNPTIVDSKTTNGTSSGSFTSNITGLTASTTYYVRAYATNSAGTSYGTTVSFTTKAAQMPVLTTTSVNSITQTKAICGGNITSDGGSAITARGVCWSTVQNPTIAHNKTSDSTGVGIYTSNVNGLSYNTTYYIRAYATNSVGTQYGNALSFTTLPQSGSTVSDIDGNVYHTVIIGTQVWMVENLRTTKYSDGTAIPLVNNNASWDALSATSKAYCWYQDNINNKATYGALYTWAAAMKGAAGSSASPSGIQGVCPTGWHLPSDAEWTKLENYLIANGFNYDGSNSGTKYAKALASATNWALSSTAGAVGNSDYPSYRNKTGFTGLPGGWRGVYGAFSELGTVGYWWSATDITGWAWYRVMSKDALSLFRGNFSPLNGYSVRCVKN